MGKIIVLMLVLSLLIPGQAFAKGKKSTKSSFHSTQSFDSTYPVKFKRRK